MEVLLQYFGDPELYVQVLITFGFILGFVTFFILYILDCIGMFFRDLIKKRREE